ncbi:cell division protein ZipA C-terminal FtsZ-binding domain-containing protein [Maioricimonas rarisocia]|nr:cell division protein ZipA C-terminal FtsZ-binding domain-containing protein [Maioricimonas rarisocia]
MSSDQTAGPDGQEPGFEMDDFVLVPSSVSRERAAQLPTEPSEDARHILGRIDLPPIEDWDEERDYLPEPAVEWVVDVQLEGDPEFDPEVVGKRFDSNWRERFGSMTIYGRDVETGLWTFLISADGPQAVDRLKFAFDYVDVLDEDAPVSTADEYAARVQEIRKQLESFGKPTVAASMPPADAEERSRMLIDIRQRLDVSPVLFLNAPASGRFDGRQMWDTMLCLGLEWGDMDCFHWPNPSDVGDDYFFSVETTTPPGYFLPEEVMADRVHVDDLVFVYSVPRCARPVEVFDAMVRGVEYCRQRLGGTIADMDGEPADITVMREQIVEIVRELQAAGFEPGVDATLRLF